MTAQAIGAKTEQKQLPLSRLSDYVTVWGAPVWHGPRQNAILTCLRVEGYTVRVRGHYIQVLLADDVSVDAVVDLIKGYGKE